MVSDWSARVLSEGEVAQRGGLLTPISLYWIMTYSSHYNGSSSLLLPLWDWLSGRRRQMGQAEGRWSRMDVLQRTIRACVLLGWGWVEVGQCPREFVGGKCDEGGVGALLAGLPWVWLNRFKCSKQKPLVVRRPYKSFIMSLYSFLEQGVLFICIAVCKGTGR